MSFRNPVGFNPGPLGLLIITNVILYVGVSINRGLIGLFGLRPATILDNPWTIITALFIHAPFPSLGHIMGNMFTLYFFGSALVQLVGLRSFLITYFAGGILGNILFLLLAPPLSIAIGASGAVFAVGGALTVMRPMFKVMIFPFPVPIPLWVAVIGGFALLSFMPGVAWQGHLGGLALGLAAGYFFRRREKQWRWY